MSENKALIIENYMSISSPYFFDRDISWLSFNERVLMEAGREDQFRYWKGFRFLSIFSSNLDEFYRVRMPALMALSKIIKLKRKREDGFEEARDNFDEAALIIHR